MNPQLVALIMYAMYIADTSELYSFGEFQAYCGAHKLDCAVIMGVFTDFQEAYHAFRGSVFQEEVGE